MELYGERRPINLDTSFLFFTKNIHLSIRVGRCVGISDRTEAVYNKFICVYIMSSPRNGGFVFFLTRLSNEWLCEYRIDLTNNRVGS